MAAHKYIDRVCLAGALFSLLLSLLFMNGQALGLRSASRMMGYETRLFDTSRVHTIDLVMDDWDAFIETCENEEYSSCAAVIDGEAYKNVGLRAKGNTSLTTVSQMNSDRYSFKIEFDHYESGRTYYGLDKLSLNNVIQDNTYMKDYLTYRLMAGFGANAPLCSFVYITVNGEDWGLYLAVEGLEDGFLQRNYGQNHGALYKPDSMSIGGGRGNGRDFDMEELMGGDGEDVIRPGGAFGEQQPSSGQRDGPPVDFAPPDRDGGNRGMGSADVKLQYIGDDPDSYANIFDNAKTEITGAGQARLIQSLKVLSEGGDISDVVDIDQVLRYFVVHNFVVNGDSYTGSMVHNYYLYEEDGRLSMLPWDYNLAFGSFQGGDASGAVNDPIDSPLSVTGGGDRPMADWIFSNEKYTRLYHQYFGEFLDTVDPAAIIDHAHALIAPYVDKDPTKFCTTEEFETAVEALKTFCALRAASVSGQLAGTIPSTGEGQSQDGSSLVDASALTLSDMGSMGRGGGPGGKNSQPSPDGTMPAPPDGKPGGTDSQRPEAVAAGNFGGGFPGGQMGGQPPENGGDQPIASLLLLGTSSLLLLAGLVAAFRFRRRRS